MDGTLTPPRQAMRKDMVNALEKLQTSGFEVGIVTGSDLEYVKEQCQALFSHFYIDKYSIHFLPCNGTKYYKFGEDGFATVYENDMRKHIGKKKWSQMIRSIFNFQSALVQSERDIPLTGNFISYRGSTLNWCPIGRQASTEDRENWSVMDKHGWIRNRWLRNARDTFDANGLQDVIIKLGGETSFDIFPFGWDKTYSFRNFNDYDELYFVGDRCGATGNDKEAYDAAGERGYSTTDPRRTIEIINQIIMEDK